MANTWKHSALAATPCEKFNKAHVNVQLVSHQDSFNVSDDFGSCVVEAKISIGRHRIRHRNRHRTRHRHRRRHIMPIVSVSPHHPDRRHRNYVISIVAIVVFISTSPHHLARLIMLSASSPIY